MKSAKKLVTAAVCLVACGASVQLSAQSREEGPQVARIWLQDKARVVVEKAVNGALRRLATPTCQLVLTDFTDASARSLAVRLETLDQTVAEFVASVYFVDGGDSAQCRSNETTVAFTEPGSRVIHVCARRFTNEFARRPDDGEILVIHELLHSLGLGENPPTSRQITEQVSLRCKSH
jgi:hypothetical protein